MIVMTGSEMKLSTALLLAVAAASLWADAAPAQQVGTAAAVNPAAQARGSGGSRTIVLGQSIAHRERIQTTAAGSVQLLFLDKTSMTIGPNSDLAIDEYVYDPNTNTGKLAATLSKGVMRFVGGQISHSGNAQVSTPNAVVGIRGGVAIFQPQSVFVGYGEGEVRSGASTVTLGAGEYTQTLGGGAPPTNPGPPPANYLQTVLATLQSQGGQGGGARASSGQVNQARASATGSQQGTIATNVQNVVNNQPVNTTSQTNTVSNLTQTVQTTTQTTIATETNDEIVRRQFSATSFAFSMTNCCGLGGATSNAPYLAPEFATGSNRYISPVMGYRTASVDTANRAPYFQWGMDVTGQGSGQSSWFFVMTGALVEDGQNGFTWSSGFGATRRGASNLSIGRASGGMSSRPGILLDEQGLPTTGEVTQQDFVATTRQYRDIQAFFFNGGGGATGNYNFSQHFARIPTPTGLGSNRVDQTLFAWTGGLMRTFNTSTNQFVGTTFQTFGYGTISLSSSLNRIQTNFNVFNVSDGDSSFNYGQFQMGSLNTSLRSRSAYVDYDNFAAREGILVSNDGSQFAQLSSINGQSLVGSTTFMANVTRDVAQKLDPNVSYCECDYTRWGFWSTDSYRIVNGQTIADRGHMMPWVAGRPTSIAEVPTTGSATYVGHVVANIRSSGNEYLASGNMSNTVNFATRTGTASVTNLDGVSYSGSLQLQSNDPRNLVGALTGSGRNMVMIGNLFRGSTSAVGEMGGSVLINGTNYLGGGIFAGRTR